jgi:hypothetical protein
LTLHLGDVPANSTLYIPFASYNSSGASVTLTGLAVTDIEIYKNGSVTQRASDAGYTLLDTDGIDFDGITGLHGFSVDLSDNTDAGFYSVGGFYWVVVSTVTIDSQTVTLIAATFRIVAAESVAGKPKVDVDAFGGTAGTFAAGIPEVKVNNIAADAITASAIAANAIGASELAADAVTEIQSGLSTLDAAGVRTAVGLASANLDTQLTACKGTTQITEAYAANGVAPTRDQAMMAIHQMLMQFAISGTSVTVKKLDNTTTAFVVTLDDAVTPTSAVRT